MEYCKKKWHQNDRPSSPNLAGRSLVDHRHRLTYCGISKAGSTMLKSLILEANGLNLTELLKSDDPLYFVHLQKYINDNRVKLMSQIRKSEQKSILANYSHILSVRHPLDRLWSYYRDKILYDDRSAGHHRRVASILKEFRAGIFASNKSLAGMRFPQDILGPPTFHEFITWIHRHKTLEEHWIPMERVCHPCSIDWRAILRVETMAVDGEIMLKHLNRRRSKLPVRHSHDPNGMSHGYFSKKLNGYNTISRDVMEYFINLYKRDMQMFGYGWHNETNVAYCVINTDNGRCC